ncbi:MAG: DUF3667 domain-containing protein [Proteobacteria bacterium]|nr:DUF3667 domain-containing protein [Pseudomonadota bacterium]
MSDVPSPTTCPNCNANGPAVAQARYCPMCGQARELHPPTLTEFAHEFVTHYVALEGALWRTLLLLLRRPGQLTLEWLEGRRQRWINPLRLYLTLSFVYFLTSAFLAPGHMLAPDAAAPAPTEAATAGDATGDGDDWLSRELEATLTDTTRSARLDHRIKAALPYTVFALVPVFAGGVALVQRRRRMAYGVHVVFALHVHAFAFLTGWLGLAAARLGDAAWSAWLAVLVVYLTLAMRRVYGGGLVGAGLRAVAVMLLHALVTLTTTVVLILGLVMT